MLESVQCEVPLKVLKVHLKIEWKLRENVNFATVIKVANKTAACKERDRERKEEEEDS